MADHSAAENIRYNVEQRCYRFNSDNAHKRIYNYI